MELLENIYKKIILTESVDVKDVEDAIDSHKRIIINYHTKGEDKNTGARVIEVYAYGLTKAGNPVIRCFQPFGDTTSRVPSWKFFRLDRISEWQPTEQVFSRPADFYYKNLGDFNPNGDETMSVVYKIAKFGDNQITNDIDKTQPKTKDDVYKTDTEIGMERLRQQLNNPIKLSDIKVGDAFKQLSKQPQTTTSEPKTKDDVYKTDTEIGMERLRQQLNNPIKLSDIKVGDAFKQLSKQPQTTTSEPKTKDDVYKTDTEIGMERLRQQLNNPKKIDLTQFERKPKEKSQEEKQKELEKLRNTLKDNPMTLADLNKKMKQEVPQEPNKVNNEPELYKTDTEKNMERLRQQLNNPRKIDLSKIPKR